MTFGNDKNTHEYSDKPLNSFFYKNAIKSSLFTQRKIVYRVAKKLHLEIEE